MVKKIFDIRGMHCNSCAQLIEEKLKDKVSKVSVSYADEKAEIDFDESKISEDEIKKIIENLGYESITENKEKINASEKRKEAKERFLREEISAEEYNNLIKETEEKEDKEIEKEEKIKVSESHKDNGTDKLGWIFVVISIIFFLALIYIVIQPYLAGFKLPEFKLPEIGEKTSLILLFVAGILTGFHCISMCGGFVVSYTAKNAIEGHKGFKQHLVYGGSKVISYAVIGGIFGLIGGIVAFSVGLRGWVAILAGVFMIFYALGMFGIKFFKKFQFNPKFLTRFASQESNKFKGAYKRPLVTGLLNGLFIACGPLQAMYLYAAGTGSFFSGAAGLTAFGLGTLPLIMGFGSLATSISHKTTGRILKISAIIVLVLGLIMLNRGLALTGSSFSYDLIKAKITGGNANSLNTVISNGIQEINMNVDASGYSPNSFVLKKGIPVKWNVNVRQLTGCNSQLVSREYNVNARLKNGLNVFEFTPDKAGTFTFSCGMGMLRGSFIVTDTGTASQQEVKAATPTAGGSCGGSGGGCGCGG